MLTTTLHPAFTTPIDTQVDGKTVNPNTLLKDLAQSGRLLIEIATDHGLTLQQLIVWIQQPAVQSLLNEADAVASRLATHRAAQARPAAVHTLTTQTMLWETARDREGAAKSSRAILRIPIEDREPTEAPLSPTPIASLRIPARPRPPRTHSANPRRSRLPISTDPTSSDGALSIPVYRFRPDTNDPIGPAARIGPTSPVEPYGVLETDSVSRAEDLRRCAGAPLH